MSKLPFMQFYANDWVADTQALSLAARGAWISLLCAMWNSQNRGVLSLPIVGYSRILGASVEQTEHVLSELSDMHICDSVEDGGVITLISRRMVNEERQRKSGATRQARLREKGGGDPERWAAIRVPILIRDEYMCAYCGRKADTVDHVIPKSKGGTEEKTNLVACCKRCNSVKNNRTLEASGLSFWHGFDQSHLSNTLVTPDISYIRSQKLEDREEIQEKKREEEEAKNEIVAPIVATPSKIAHDFFYHPEKQQELVEIMTNEGADKAFADQQVRSFVDYWTELNKSGTKQRWQLEPTFEVQRRLKTWFDRAGKFGKPTERKGIRL